MGYQEKSWNEILQHQLFITIGDDIAGNHDYEWILSKDERTNKNEVEQAEIVTETLSKIYQIFVARSAALFTPEHILL